jgi:hypothetical protein
MPSLLFLLLLLLPYISLVSSKYISGRTTLQTGYTFPVGKFSFRPPGDGTVKGSVLYRGPARGTLYLFMDTEWQNYHTKEDHCVRMSFATSKLKVGSVHHEKQGLDVIGRGILTSSVIDRPDGQSEWEFTWQIEHQVRTYGYYLVFGICDAEDDGGGVRWKPIEYRITLLNPGNDHFPGDEHGLLTTYTIALVMLLGFAAYSIVLKPGTFVDTYGVRPPGMVTLLVTLAYMAEVFSLLSEILHLWWYSSNGYGIFAFDLLSEILEGFAQTVLGYLLIAFACGWTLIEGALTAKHNNPVNPEALGEDHITTVFMFGIVLLTILLQLLNKVVLFDDFTKFHDHETWPGILHVCVRAMLAMVFSTEIIKTIQFQSRRGGGGRAIQFLRSLALWGGIWFWCFPILVAVASLFAHYLRHRVVTGGVLVLQTGCLMMLTGQLTRDYSSYSKAHVYGGTVLPTSAQKGV